MAKIRRTVGPCHEDWHLMEFALFVPCALWTTNAERRMHYHVRADKVEPVRTSAKLLTLNIMRDRKFPPYTTPVHVEFFPTQKPGVLADTANHLPPCKAVLDGIVAAGLLVDDNPEHVLSQRFWPPIKGKRTGVGVLIVPAK